MILVITSYKDVLDKEEYSASYTIEGVIIKARAYFKKSLPFEIPFTKDTNPLLFKNEKVVSFGCYGYHESAQIIYYNNDNDFAIKLSPVDKEHQIILIKSNFSTTSTLLEQVENFQNAHQTFLSNKNERNRWKYYIDWQDRIRIPIIQLHIETDYKNITGSKVETALIQYDILKAYQRTFLLDKKGFRRFYRR